MCVYMQTDTYTCVYTYTHIHTPTFTYVSDTYIYIYICTDIYIYIYIHLYIYIYIHICMEVCVEKNHVVAFHTLDPVVHTPWNASMLHTRCRALLLEVMVGGVVSKTVLFCIVTRQSFWHTPNHPYHDNLA